MKEGYIIGTKMRDLFLWGVLYAICIVVLIKEKLTKMATYQIEYTLPGEYGKVHKKTFKSAPERDAGIKKLKEKGAKIKATVWKN